MDGLELINIADRLDALVVEFNQLPEQSKLAQIGDTCVRVGRSWSGSNLGYHATVYYANFEQPPPGAHFSSMSGLRDNWPLESTAGDWREYRHSDVLSEIQRLSGNPDIEPVRKLSRKIEAAVEDAKEAVTSILSVHLDSRPDAYVSDVKEKVANEKIMSEPTAMRAILPSGQFVSQDMLAMSQGLRVAPHQEAAIKAALLTIPPSAASNIAKLARQVGSHLARLDKQKKKSTLVGTNVFIGHGRSLQWMALKDFVKDRLHLPHDEFNRVPVAGVTNIARLLEMLDAAAIAFIILTAEDEQKDGKMQARMNVIHEVGLFQGRLGFSRAVVMLEEGCEEFSNIQGLGQIRFPRGRIDAAFEEVRRVLERENLVGA
ncbi:UNVERIFIED_ORG: putative nucleotide-binding protein [Shinella zoogloeoides]|nr:putative nucleotide-binding protein [Shinella zoogloeoides]